MDAFIEQNGVALKKGAREAVDFLEKENILKAVTTSSPQARVKAHLSLHGLYAQFDKICTGYDVQHSKPAPDIYLYGAKALNVLPQNALALEDSPSGMQSAMAAGTMAVFVPDLDSITLNMKERCFASIDSLLDLPALLLEIKRLQEK